MLGESSSRRLYCSLTKGVIPQVCGQESQNFLERQVVGLTPFLPLVGPGSGKHCTCGLPQGVSHTAFKCPELVVQRQSLLSALDAERANMAQGSCVRRPHRLPKADTIVLPCPSRLSTLPEPENCTFYSASAKAWRRFYGDAEEVGLRVVRATKGG